MRRLLLVLVAAILALGVAAVPGYADPLTVTAPVNVSVPTPFPPGCGGPTEGNFPGDELQLSQQRGRAVDRGEPRRTRTTSRRSGSRTAGRTAARTVCWPRSATTAARRSPTRRRTSATARAAPRPTAATTAAPRTRGSRGRPTATCGRSPSPSTGRRRATPCWRRACAMARATWSEPFVLRADNSRTGVPLAQQLQRQGVPDRRSDRRQRQPRLRGLGSPRHAELQRAAPGARALALLARPDVVRAHDLGRRGDPGVGARPADLRPGRPQPDDLQPDRRAPRTGR